MVLCGALGFQVNGEEVGVKVQISNLVLKLKLLSAEGGLHNDCSALATNEPISSCVPIPMEQQASIERVDHHAKFKDSMLWYLFRM